MGLDVTAYKNVKLVGIAADGDEWEEKFDYNKTDWVYPDQDFLDKLPPIQPGGVYEYGDKFGFHPGAYSSYNEWRNELSLMALGVEARTVWANPARYKPFVELINFSDCEGVLGTEVCRKLLQDFMDHQEKANSYQGADEDETEWFVRKYHDWLRAFEYAADGGYIRFH